MKTIKTFCLIIGSGAAGLEAGISFLKNFSTSKKEIKKCIIVSPIISNSRISPWNIMDCSEKEIKEKIWNAGNHLSDPEILKTFSENHKHSISILKELEIPLKKSNIGYIPCLSGTNIINIFEKKFISLGGERINGFVEKYLVNQEGIIKGAVVYHGNERINLIASKIIIASGGLTSLYKYTTGYSYDSMPNILALSLEAGIALENLEFNMFHPFLIIDKNLSTSLISGEILQKGKYADNKGKEFLSKEIKDALINNTFHSLFPKMVNEFYTQSLKSKVYMDISNLSDDYFERYKKENEFGWIFKNKKLNEVKKFEIHPAFHYSIGGIKINSKSETNQEGVYAAGEVTTGLHGANRIGGFAISEALVFGKIAGENAAANITLPKEDNLTVIGNSLIDSRIKNIFWNNLGPIKKYKDLESLKTKISLKNNLSSEEKLVLEIIKSSIKRRSIGANFII